MKQGFFHPMDAPEKTSPLLMQWKSQVKLRTHPPLLVASMNPLKQHKRRLMSLLHQLVYAANNQDDTDLGPWNYSIITYHQSLQAQLPIQVSIKSVVAGF